MRLSPDDELAEVARRLAQPRQQQDDADATSMFIFRLDQNLLALPTSFVRQIAVPGQVHPIPARNRAVLRGLASLDGRLELCVRLANLLLGSASLQPRSHWLLFGPENDAYLGEVDDWAVVSRVCARSLEPPPPGSSLLRGVFVHQGSSVGYVDPEALLAAVGEAIRQ